MQGELNEMVASNDFLIFALAGRLVREIGLSDLLDQFLESVEQWWCYRRN